MLELDEKKENLPDEEKSKQNLIEDESNEKPMLTAICDNTITRQDKTNDDEMHEIIVNGKEKIPNEITNNGEDHEQEDLTDNHDKDNCKDEIREESKRSEVIDSKSGDNDNAASNSIANETSITTDQQDGNSENAEDPLKTSKSSQDDKNEEDNGADDPEKSSELLEFLLKKCSPQKLKEVSQLISRKITEHDIVCEDQAEKKTREEVDKNLEKIVESSSSPEVSASKSEDCIILIDSDDEAPPPLKRPKLDIECPKTNDTELPPVEEENETHKMEVDNEENQTNDNQEIKEENQQKSKKILECANSECLKKSSNFVEASNFMSQLYYIPVKKDFIYHLCVDCFESGIKKYEELVGALHNGKSLLKVKIKARQETVQVLDSDDEDDKVLVKRDHENEEKVKFDVKTESEVEEIIRDIFSRFDIKSHFDRDRDQMQKRLEELEDLSNGELLRTLRSIDKKAEEFHNDLDGVSRPKYERRKSVDLNSASQQNSVTITKISSQKIVNDRLQLAASSNEKIRYALKVSNPGKMQNWARCLLVNSTINQAGKFYYDVKFFDSNTTKKVSGKELALSRVNRKLKVGDRVLANFERYTTKGTIKRFLPGVIGERLTFANKLRYLVFCDYGEVQYIQCHEVKEIVDASKNVWEDVHENIKIFLKAYLQNQSPRRPLALLQVGNTLKTQRDGRWMNTRVMEIDCSMVKLKFEDGRYEWIYRGSRRLFPIYSRNQSLHTNSRRHDPNIIYTIIDDEFDEESSLNKSAEKIIEPQVGTKKNIAKKSCSKSAAGIGEEVMPALPAPAPVARLQPKISMGDRLIYIDDPKIVSRIRHFMPKENIHPRPFRIHKCSSECIPPIRNLVNHGPLTKPLLSNWEREITKSKNKRFIIYRAPCGRRLRDMYEVRDYLNITGCHLNVENFTFDVNVQVLVSYQVVNPKECPFYLADISEGKEGMKVPAVNAFDSEGPPQMIYTAKRLPQNFKINTDPEFMACCDCTDDCADKTKCACFQTTIQSCLSLKSSGDYGDEIGYEWKRLNSVVQSGIYECHSRCKCTSRCLNKVVQQPIQVKMQMFRTKDKGWGLQACHDIAKGTFICIYAGKLYREDDTDVLCDGVEDADEYFAELDLIETLAPQKENYEAGVKYPDSDEDDDEDENDEYEEDAENEEDADFSSELQTRTSMRRKSLRNSRKTSSVRKSTSNGGGGGGDSDNDEIMPTQDENSKNAPKSAAEAFRRLYHEKEKVYIMDAKYEGNIGRYFNHSCDPNLFVQNVFVDTHDMRFPWIAFFTQRHVRAGEELTWNYNYTVGDVPTKVLYCKCGAKNCKKRIL